MDSEWQARGPAAVITSRLNSTNPLLKTASIMYPPVLIPSLPRYPRSRPSALADSREPRRALNIPVESKRTLRLFSDDDVELAYVTHEHTKHRRGPSDEVSIRSRIWPQVTVDENKVIKNKQTEKQSFTAAITSPWRKSRFRGSHAVYYRRFRDGSSRRRKKKEKKKQSKERKESRNFSSKIPFRSSKHETRGFTRLQPPLQFAKLPR